MIQCDICKEDVTEPSEEGIEAYQNLEISDDKHCLCNDCYNAIAEWILSKDCKKYCLANKKEMEKLEEK